MRVVAVDPGTKPGAVQLDGATGAVLRVAATTHPKRAPWIYETGWDIAATELQWFFGNRGARRTPAAGAARGARARTVDVNDLLRLAFRAGFVLACIPAARSLAILPQDWRIALGYGSGLSKEQVQKKIADNLTAPERQVIVESVPASRHGDVLDAIGIGRAAIELAKATTKHDWTIDK
jgi:hypothetical protein